MPFSAPQSFIKNLEITLVDIINDVTIKILSEPVFGSRKILKVRYP